MRTQPDMPLARETGVGHGVTAVTRRQLDRRIFALAIPAVGALAADPLLSLVDTAFVAGLGASALAALGVTGAIFGFAFVLFNFLAYATTPLVASAIGRDDQDGARLVVGRALFLAVTLGAGSTGVLLVLAEPLVRVMQAGPDVIDPAVSYLRIRALAAPAVLIVTAGHGAFRGLQDTRTPLLVAMLANLINVVLDPVLIYGLNFGVAGAAAASAIAQYAAAIWMWRKLRARLGPIQAGLGRSAHLSSLLTAGGILTIRTLLLVLTLALGTAAAASVGTPALAAHQVVRETWFLTAMLTDGLAIAAQALVAEHVGRRDEATVAAINRRLLWWGLLIGTVIAVGWLAGAPLLSAAFAPTAEVGGLIEAAARIAGLLAPAAAIVWVLDGIIMGRMAFKGLIASTGAGLVAGATVFYLSVTYGWGLPGVWWGMSAMILARLVVLIALVRR
ncbi:MAG TPA: MATE family efflux transporter [Acidimicrobiia bacterium]|nr:MATE family efflux transporter [Acidimicrobiia bacterium]